MASTKQRILILGVSGFIGKALYKEFCSLYKTYGTYRRANAFLEKNTHLFEYDIEEDDIYDLLNRLKPTIIISAIRGNFAAQVIAHKHITEYIQNNDCKIIFLSAANVFDAYSKYPSYEDDTTLSNSIFGHFKIKIEQLLLKLPEQKVAILRLPMVFGIQGPRVEELKFLHANNQAIELFPNIIMNIISDTRLTQQIHYIINRKKFGIFHLGSKDLVHHDDFIKDLCVELQLKKPKFKLVYTTNNERYLAVLSKINTLPKHLCFSTTEIMSDLKLIL